MLKAPQSKNKVVFLLILILVLLFSQITADSADPPEVRVKISMANSHVELSFDSGYILIDRSEGSILPLSPGRYRLVNANGKVQVLDISGNNQGVFAGPLYLKPLSAVPNEHFFQLHNARFGKEYRGALEVFVDGNALAAVNILDLESYLRGVLPREISASWGNYGGMEALKAQAVVSRSYTLYNLGQQRHTGFHLCDTEHCQVYGGKSYEMENTDLALEQTRGEILTFNGICISPFYHASNGGFTEVPQNVWTGSLPYYSSVPDPYDDPANPLGLTNFVKHRYAEWKKDVPIGSLGILLANRGVKNPADVERVEIASFFLSGRVQELRLHDTSGHTVSFFKEEARDAFGLRSQLFTVRSEPEPHVWIASSVNGIETKECFSELEGKWVLSGNTMKRMLIGESFSVLGEGIKSVVPYLGFVFEGHGWGHGVGMSQNGAYNRARAGQGYREILSFYYPGTEIEKWH